MGIPCLGIKAKRFEIAIAFLAWSLGFRLPVAFRLFIAAERVAVALL